MFAGGDAIAGERSVTIAVGHGKKRGAAYRRLAARRALPSVAEGAGRDPSRCCDLPVYSDADPSPQRTLRSRETDRRIRRSRRADSTRRRRAHEAQRCLSCGNCFECDNCFAACPETAIVRLGPTHGYRVDMDLCTGCAVCVEQCPCHAMEMVADVARPISFASTPRAEGAVR